MFAATVWKEEEEETPYHKCRSERATFWLEKFGLFTGT